MQKLKSLNFCYLTEHVLKLLNQNHIITILDFLQEDVTKLSSITKLNLPEILSIRNYIFSVHSAPVLNGSTLIQKVLGVKRRICTGIESINTIIDGGIPIGYITEICGLAESGKTQLLYQLAINCAKNEESRVLYVDTKGDFSAVRIQNILLQRQYSYKEMSLVMQKIKVVHIWIIDELVALFKSIKNRIIDIPNLSIIIVDSLPCLMFQYLGDENKMGLSYLNTLVNYSRYIANEFNVGIIYVNIQTRWIDSDIFDTEEDGEVASTSKEPTYTEKRNRCIGRYWDQIPALVLILEKMGDSYKNINDSTPVKVSVLCSNSIKTLGNECIINISASGVT